MNRQRKLLLIGCFLFIDILLVGVFFVIREVTLKSILRNEINALVELDFTKDRYDVKVKSSGNYGTVEQAIKKYLDRYAVDVQDVLGYVNDDGLDKMTTYDNYVLDGPLFINSFNYIDSYREKFNDNIDELIESSTEENINYYIYEYTDDAEYIDMYNNLLLENNFINEINYTRNMLMLKKIEINSYFDSIVRVLDYLSINRDYYHLENGNIMFYSDEKRIEYEKLLGNIKKNLA